MNIPQLEICCADVESVKAAVDGGADRIELCAALSEGGVTPSVGLIRQSAKLVENRALLHVLIRPRGGDFLYSSIDVDTMLFDIHMAREEGANGVVIGALTPQGDIDVDVCRQLIDAAQGMNITFHRAFDMCNDAYRAIDTIAALGCNRILTSGQAHTAEAGIPNLCKYANYANGRLSILAGCGVSPKNATKILQSGVYELHASARHTVSSAMTYRHECVKMGADGNDEYARSVTSAEIVRQIANIVHSHTPTNNTLK